MANTVYRSLEEHRECLINEMMTIPHNSIRLHILEDGTITICVAKVNNISYFPESFPLVVHDAEEAGVLVTKFLKKTHESQ